jgi:hypothetical protein
MSIAAPNAEIHFRNKGALLRSQPVAPPNKSRGDKAVPRPNKTASEAVYWSRKWQRVEEQSKKGGTDD